MSWEYAKDHGIPCNLSMKMVVLASGLPAVLVSLVSADTDEPVAYCLAGVDDFFMNCSHTAEAYNEMIGGGDEACVN